MIRAAELKINSNHCYLFSYEMEFKLEVRNIETEYNVYVTKIAVLLTNDYVDVCRLYRICCFVQII